MRAEEVTSGFSPEIAVGTCRWRRVWSHKAPIDNRWDTISSSLRNRPKRKWQAFYWLTVPPLLNSLKWKAICFFKRLLLIWWSKDHRDPWWGGKARKVVQKIPTRTLKIAYYTVFENSNKQCKQFFGKLRLFWWCFKHDKYWKKISDNCPIFIEQRSALFRIKSKKEREREWF